MVPLPRAGQAGADEPCPLGRAVGRQRGERRRARRATQRRRRRRRPRSSARRRCGRRGRRAHGRRTLLQAGEVELVDRLLDELLVLLGVDACRAAPSRMPSTVISAIATRSSPIALSISAWTCCCVCASCSWRCASASAFMRARARRRCRGRASTMPSRFGPGLGQLLLVLREQLLASALRPLGGLDALADRVATRVERLWIGPNASCSGSTARSGTSRASRSSARGSGRAGRWRVALPRHRVAAAAMRVRFIGSEAKKVSSATMRRTRPPR